ncbi:MAG: hypothetical protein ACYCWW_14805 [Deltaproteobacteria bacterium]
MRTLPLALALTLLPALSCRGRRRPSEGAVSPRALAPADADAYLETPSLGQLVANGWGFAQALEPLPGGDAIAPAADQLAGMLGFDPRAPGALASVGLDERRPAALIVERQASWVALPIADEGRFRSAIDRIALSRLGAEKPSGTGRVRHYTGPSGSAALAFGHGYALLRSPDGDGDPLGRALARKPEESLERSPVAPLALSRLLPGEDLLLYAPPSTLVAHGIRWAPGRGFAIGLSLANRRIALRALDLFSVAEGAGLSPLSLPAGGELVPLLPPASPLVLRLGGEPAALVQAWSWALPSALVEAAHDAKLDLGRELFSNLKPGIALAVGLAQSPDLSSASLDPRRSNPFRIVTLEALARVREPTRAREALPKLLALAPRFGATVEPIAVPTLEPVAAAAAKPSEGVPAWRFRYAQGEGVSVALSGDLVVVTGGEAVLGPALARARGKGPHYTPSPPLVHALQGHVSDGLALDTDALRLALESLPDGAFGGLTGFTLRSVLERVELALSHLGPLTAILQFDADAATLDAELRLLPAEATRAPGTR